jgi:pimeloyl-ACP methyl ester carboxylesterase
VAKKLLNYNKEDFEISYEILNQKADKNLIILHGWGSNKALMKQAFKDYMPEFKHIYIDLPGFGNSTSKSVLDSYDYANILNIFFKMTNIKKDIILGHSFGGKVACLLNPDMLILVSSAGILLPKPLDVKIKITLFKILKSIGLNGFKKFFVANDAKELPQNMYETFKIVVNEDFREVFANYKNKALLLWGKEDTATPLKTANEINKLIKNSKLISYDGDHYFFLKHKKEISKEILSFYKEEENV